MTRSGYTLGRRMTRRLPNKLDVSASATMLGRDLLAVGEQVPQSDWLILGGSLARGEPSFVPSGASFRLLSDVDLLYVHGTDRPQVDVDDLKREAERTLSAVDIDVLSLDQYRRLRTALGHDYKNLGVSLVGRKLPDHDPVAITVRDAYEMVLYAVAAYFWSGLFDHWLRGCTSTDPDRRLNRLCMKVLRSTALLDGAHACRDLHLMAPHTRDRMRAELAWRADPTKPPLDPGRFWTYLRDALCRFDTEFGGPRRDAITGTRYHRSIHGQVVAEYQRLAYGLACDIADLAAKVSDASALIAIKDRSWRAYKQSTESATAEQYFGEHKADLKHHLLAMSVED